MKKLKQILKILNFIKVKKFYLLILLTVGGSVLEAVGVSIIFPISKIIFYQNGAEFIYVQELAKNINLNLNHQEIVIYVLFFLIFFWFLKTIFLSILAYFQSYYISNIEAKVSYCIFNEYLNKNFEFHCLKNSAMMIKDVVAESKSFASSITSLSNLIVEIFTLIAISCVVVYIEPVGALLGFFLFTTGTLLINFIVKKKVKRWGEERYLNEGERFKQLEQSLMGIKEMKLNNNKNLFLQNYIPYNSIIASVNKKIQVVISLPKIWLELLTIISIVFLIFFIFVKSLNNPSSMTNFLPTIAVFGAASVRIMPCFARILNYLQTFRYSYATIFFLINLIDNKNKDLDFSQDLSKKNLSKNLYFKNSITFNNLSFFYKNGQKNILNNINLRIKKNEFVGILGKSGSGKTTLINLLTGLLWPISGNIFLDKEEITKNNINSFRKKIAYVPQNIFIADDTIEKNITFGDEKTNRDLFNKSVKWAKLEELINSRPLKEKSLIGQSGSLLSGGQKQRIALARAFYKNPEILIFDEATSALDFENEKQILDTIISFKNKITIIMITHKKEIISCADRILEIKNNNVIELN